MKPTLTADVETYRNYFLIGFRNVETGAVRHFELFEGHPLDIKLVQQILVQYRIVSFNGNNYDMPLIYLALKGAGNSVLKDASDNIILNNLRSWHFEEKYKVKIPPSLDHIDIIEVAPGMASLKIYGGRIHCRKMQDLPIEPSALITPEQRPLLRTYNANDLETTEVLYKKLAPQIELRDKMSLEYEQDLRSKSDAQIAEAVIKSRIEKLTGTKPSKPDLGNNVNFKYKPPAFIGFTSEAMRSTLAMVVAARFDVSPAGKVLMPKELADHKIHIGNSVYRMGIGGLHSSEKSVSYYSDAEWMLVDRDVVSYYPAIILLCGLYPKHLGRVFLEVYKAIVDKRIAAKKAGDKVTAESLKITVNGSFGKLGSMWSALYSPDLMIQTTVTGQLSLLMLIEMLEAEGIAVVSANTDGVVMRVRRRDKAKLDEVVASWEMLTGFETEETQYLSLHSRDINNYIALKDGGVVKTKGAYAPAGLQKNPTNEICTDAVINYLSLGVSVEDTVRCERDVRKFLSIRTVKGGAVKGDEVLGKALRWYYSSEVIGDIRYKLNNYTVPRSEGAMPLMELPDAMPRDVNHQWYIDEANDILADIGVKI